MLPDFTPEGFLPPGLHECTWSEFVARYGNGPKREQLLPGMQRILNLLAQVRCKEVRIGGSFVTAKERPGDFDGVWASNEVDWKCLPLELWGEVRAQPEVFGGTIVSDDWEYTDIGHYARALTVNRAGVEVGVVILHPAEVPMIPPLRYHEKYFSNTPA